MKRSAALLKLSDLPKPSRLGRRDVADLLGLHPDRVSHLMHEGLAGCVLEWGGHGREIVFDAGQVERWRRARACEKSGRPWCPECANVRFDIEATAEHLVETRHGLGGCRECKVDYPLCKPCEASR